MHGRKLWDCELCPKPICVGEPYRYWRVKIDDTLRLVRVHPECKLKAERESGIRPDRND